MLPFASSYFYYIEIALQAVCAIHCIRRGNQNKWLWIIVFLPLIGCIIYIFSEMRPSQGIKAASKIDIAGAINPNSRIKKLEDNVKFSNTFDNRIKLADAYLSAGQTDRAIEIYEQSLTGSFDENEHGIMQLGVAYFTNERYDDAINVLQKVNKTQQFARSQAHIVYAKSLEFSGKPDLAENEFKTMKGRYSNFEQRYEYGLFLIRADRVEEAAELFEQIAEEAPQLSSMERRYNRVWIGKSKDELRKLYAD